jgi:hypothetical protein
MKILITNLNVGSGIEYVGDKIINWVKETNNDIIEYKHQTCVSHFTDELIKVNPDIIIINEYFPRIIEPVFYYKKYNPQVKVLFFPHSWKMLWDMPEDEKNYLTQRMIYLFVNYTCDEILCLSKKYIPEMTYIRGIGSKLKELYMPVSSEEYKIITPWKDRKKLFGSFSNPSETRLSQKFIDKIKNTDLQIDIYSSESENDRIKDISNFNKYPKIKQENMPKILNEYKFFVLPHNNEEVFFITLLQSIMCGTIPLVVNNRNSKTFDPRWIDWAEGLYFGTSTVEPFIENLKLFTKDKLDLTSVSNHISQTAQKRFDENIIKNEVLEFVSKCGII